MLVTVAEAAKELGLCRAHIRRKIRSGEWPAYRFGYKATRLDLNEIMEIARCCPSTQIKAERAHVRQVER